MKYLLLLFLSALILTSCLEVRFNEPQPQNGRSLKHFPKNYIGAFVNGGGDTLYIAKDNFYIADDETKFLNSQRVELKHHKGLYILSCKELFLDGDTTDRLGWEVFPTKLVEDSLLIYHMPVSKDDNLEKCITCLKAITTLEAIHDDKSNIDYYLTSPTKKEFNKIIERQIFNEVDTFIRLPN